MKRMIYVEENHPRLSVCSLGRKSQRMKRVSRSKENRERASVCFSRKGELCVLKRVLNGEESQRIKRVL